MIAALYVELGESVASRLAARLRRDDATGCLLWTGYRNAKGYGTISVSTSKPGFTHRIAWELAYGPISAGLCVLHRCDTPSCCNVDHLFLGTRAENNADMKAKGRARLGVAQAMQTHCKYGHAFTTTNTRLYAGKRVCKTCAREWMRRARMEGRHE